MQFRFFFGTILVHKYEFEIENNDNQYIKTCVNVNNNEKENIKNIKFNKEEVIESNNNDL